MKTHSLILLCLMLSLSSCKKTASTTDSAGPESSSPQSSTISATIPATPLVAPFRIYRLLAISPQNISFSPPVLKSALSIAYPELAAPQKTKLEQLFDFQTQNEKLKDAVSPFSTESKDPKKHLTNISTTLEIKGPWTIPFEKDKTINAHFQSSPHGSSTCRFMRKKSFYRYYENKITQWLELPIQNSSMVMLLALPKEHFELKKTEELLSADYLNQLDHQLKRERVDIALPKFNLEQKSPLNDIINMSGNDFIFNKNSYPKKSNFFKNPISKITQNTSFRIDENGMNTNNETTVIPKEDSSVVLSFTKNFYAAEPFLVILKNIKSNEIVLLGRVYQP